MYKRRCAREQAFIIIFENMFNHESVSCITRMAEIYRDVEIIPFGKKIAKYAIDNQTEIDGLIEKYSKRWEIERISKMFAIESDVINYDTMQNDGINNAKSEKDVDYRINLIKKIESSQY